MNKSLAIALLSVTALSYFGPASARVQGQPAEIGLTISNTDPRIINGIGGKTTIEAIVSNTAPVGSSNLDYQIQFQLPYGLSPPASDTLAAQMQRTWTYVFDSTLLAQPIQFSSFSATAIVSAPGASNNSQSRNTVIDVRNRVTPLFARQLPGMDVEIAIEPTISPEQFAATGGGESFAAAAPQVIGDPVLDADLDFDRLEAVGDAEITAKNIDLFKSLPALQEGENPLLVGRKPFDVYLDKSHAGTFRKTFYLYFSDENIPGARPPESIVRTLTYTFIVVPEPTAAAIFMWGSSLLVLMEMRRQSTRAACKRR